MRGSAVQLHYKTPKEFGSKAASLEQPWNVTSFKHGVLFRPIRPTLSHTKIVRVQIVYMVFLLPTLPWIAVFSTIYSTHYSARAAFPVVADQAALSHYRCLVFDCGRPPLDFLFS